MIKENKEVHTVEQEVTLSTTFFCDICKKEIGTRVLLPKKVWYRDKGFYEITLVNHWDGELPMSEYKHACSGECLHMLLSEYIKVVEKDSIQLDFNVEKEYTHKE